MSEKANVSQVKSFLDSVIQENGLQVAPQPESQPVSSTITQNVADFTGQQAQQTIEAVN